MILILSREGLVPRVTVFFKPAAQAVLLFGSETWVSTSPMRQALGGFQDQVVRLLTGRLPRQKIEGKWTHKSAATTREEAGFLKMDYYIRQCNNTVTQYIATRSLLDL